MTLNCSVSLLILFCLALPATVFAADKTPDQLVSEARAAIGEISVVEVKILLNGATPPILVDVRDRHEFAEGHLPGAINISRGTLEFGVQGKIPDKSSRIIVYCGTDRRSPLAVAALKQLGYLNVLNMSGGLIAWEKAGFSVVK